MASSNPLLDALRRLFGGQLFTDKVRFASKEDKAAFQAYDGLMGSYKTKIRFPVVVNGVTHWNEVSVADLGFIAESDSDAAERDAKQFLGELLSVGVASRFAPSAQDVYALRGPSFPNPVWRTDTRVIDPKLLLKFPSILPPDTYPLQNGVGNSGKHNPNPNALPGIYPTMKLDRYKPLYPTPKVLNRTDYTDDMLVAHLQRAITVCERLLRARNCNMAYHPIAIACSVPPFARAVPSGHHYDMARSFDPAANGVTPIWEMVDPAINLLDPHPRDADSWNRDYVRGWRKPLAGSSPNGPGGICQFYTNDPLWRDSLAKRMALTGTRGIGAAGFNINSAIGSNQRANVLLTNTADAVFDLWSAVTLLDAILQTSCDTGYSQQVLVDLHATCTVYDIAQRRMFDQLGLNYGTDIERFRVQLDREAKERARVIRSNIVRGAGVAGYNSHGNTDEDITAATMGTVQLAIENAKQYGIVGGITSIIGSGLGALMTALAANPQPINPLELQLFVVTNGAALWGIKAGDPGVGYPMIRYPR